MKPTPEAIHYEKKCKKLNVNLVLAEQKLLYCRAAMRVCVILMKGINCNAYAADVTLEILEDALNYGEKK